MSECHFQLKAYPTLDIFLWHGSAWQAARSRDQQYIVKQDAQLSQRDRAAGCIIVFAKSRRLELGDNILRTL